MIPFFFHVCRNHHFSLTSSFVVMETKPSGRDVVEHPGVGGCISGTVLGGTRVGTTHPAAGRESGGLCSPSVLRSLSSGEPSHLDRLGERPQAAPYEGGRRVQAGPSTLCRAPAVSQDTRARHSSRHLSRLEEPSRTWCCLQPRAAIPGWNWPAQGWSSGISLY